MRYPISNQTIMKYILTLLLLATTTITFAQSGANPNYDQALGRTVGGRRIGHEKLLLRHFEDGSEYNREQ
jgi:hypothetical protein